MDSLCRYGGHSAYEVFGEDGRTQKVGERTENQRDIHRNWEPKMYKNRDNQRRSEKKNGEEADRQSDGGVIEGKLTNKIPR